MSAHLSLHSSSIVNRNLSLIASYLSCDFDFVRNCHNFLQSSLYAEYFARLTDVDISNSLLINELLHCRFGNFSCNLNVYEITILLDSVCIS